MSVECQSYGRSMERIGSIKLISLFPVFDCQYSGHYILVFVLFPWYFVREMRTERLILRVQLQLCHNHCYLDVLCIKSSANVKLIFLCNSFSSSSEWLKIWDELTFLAPVHFQSKFRRIYRQFFFSSDFFLTLDDL